MLIHQLLEKWGRDGLKKFVGSLQQKYARSAAVAAAAAEEHLTGLAEWRPAKAGMFLWMNMIGERLGRIAGCVSVITCVTQAVVNYDVPN